MTPTGARIFPRVGKGANIRSMMGGTRERLTESTAAFRAVFRNPDLRRIELALTGSVTGEWAYAIALAVYAFERGGAAAVGLVGLIRFLILRALVVLALGAMGLDIGIVGPRCVPLLLLLGHAASFRYRQRMASRPHDDDGYPYLPTRWKTRKHPLDDGRDA